MPTNKEEFQIKHIVYTEKTQNLLNLQREFKYFQKVYQKNKTIKVINKLLFNAHKIF